VEAKAEHEAVEVESRRPLKIIVALAIAIALFVLLRGLPGNQAQVAAVFAFTVTLWATEALPLAVTAIMGTGLLVLVAGVDEKAAFKSFGDPIVLLFIGSFTLAKAFEVNGLHERIAHYVLRQRFATRSASSLLLTVGVVGLVFSLFLSNTATTVMMLPIAVSILQRMRQTGPGSKFGPAMMLMLTWSTAFAVGTPVATPPNLIALGFIEEELGRKVSFGQWMAFGMPVSIVMLLIGWGVLCLMFLRRSQIEVPSDLGMGARSRMSRGEKSTVWIFVLVLLLWLAPDTATLLFGPDHQWSVFVKDHFTNAVAAVVGMALCYIVPARGTESGRTLTWRQGRTIQWGTVMLFGGGLALGDATIQSGLAKSIGEGFTTLSGANTVWSIALVASIAVVIVSELASNTTAVSMLVPVVIGIALAANVDPLPAVIATALAGSLGFMLPVSTPPNAIVYGSGHLSARQLLTSGVYIDVIGIVVTLAILYLALPLLGLV
jgi:sodium-dependent dicarboxylate transporter 2/3/5